METWSRLEITFTASCSIRRSQCIYTCTIYTCSCSMINYPSGYDHCVVARVVSAEQIPLNTVARWWPHESAWIHSTTICTRTGICQQQFVAAPWSHGYTFETGWINPVAANGEIKTTRSGEFARHHYWSRRPSFEVTSHVPPLESYPRAPTKILLTVRSGRLPSSSTPWVLRTSAKVGEKLLTRSLVLRFVAP